MTLIQAIDAARYLLNDPLNSARSFPDNTSSFWTDNVLTTFSNLVQDEIQGELIQVFEDYFVTQSSLNIVADTSDYALPSGTIKIRRVEDIRDSQSPREIFPVSLNHRESFDRVAGTSAGGEGGYYIRGSQIVLTDTPSFTNASAIRVWYVRKITDLATASDVSEIPIEHHRVLSLGIAKMAMFQQQGDTTWINAEYDKALAKMKSQAEDRQLQRPRGVIRSSERDYYG